MCIVLSFHPLHKWILHTHVQENNISQLQFQTQGKRIYLTHLRLNVHHLSTLEQSNEITKY